MDNSVTEEHGSNDIEDYTKTIIRDDSELQEDNWFSFGLKQQQLQKEKLTRIEFGDGFSEEEKLLHDLYMQKHPSSYSDDDPTPYPSFEEFKQKYTKQQKEMENTEQTNEQQTTGEDIKIIDFLELEKEYPLSIQALKDWFLSRFQIENAEVIMEQYSMLITDGQRGMFLNPRDLYDFFDSFNVRPFIIPEENFPKVKYVIQSKKSFIESEDIYDDRGAAETEAFIKTFYYIEVTLQHIKRKEESITDKD